MSYNPEKYYLKRLGNCEFRPGSKNFQFKDRLTTFGRARTSNHILKNMRCSINHCQIEFEDGRMFLNDVGSSAGTFINDRKIRNEKVELFENSVVGIGADPNRSEHLNNPKLYIYQVLKTEPPIAIDSDDETLSTRQSQNGQEENSNLPNTDLSQLQISVPAENKNLEAIAVAGVESVNEQIVDEAASGNLISNALTEAIADGNADFVESQNRKEIRTMMQSKQQLATESDVISQNSRKEVAIPSATLHEHENSSGIANDQLIPDDSLKRKNEDLLEEIDEPITEKLCWRNGMAMAIANSRKKRKRGRPSKIEKELKEYASSNSQANFAKDSKDNIKLLESPPKAAKDRRSSIKRATSSSSSSVNEKSESLMHETQNLRKSVTDFQKEKASSHSSPIEPSKSAYTYSNMSKQNKLAKIPFPSSRSPSPENPSSKNHAAASLNTKDACNASSSDYSEKFQHLYKGIQEKSNLSLIRQPKPRRQSVFEEQAKIVPENLKYDERLKKIRRWNKNETQLIDEIPQQDPQSRKKGRPKLTGEEKLNRHIERRKTLDERKFDV